MTTKLRPLAKSAPASSRESFERDARATVAQTRRRLGLSQHELSMKLGVARSTVERWEAGQSTIPAWALVALDALVSGRRVA